MTTQYICTGMSLWMREMREGQQDITTENTNATRSGAHIAVFMP